MHKKFLLAIIFSALSGALLLTAQPRKFVTSLMNGLWQTSCADTGDVRRQLMEEMQPYADSCTHTMWKAHYKAAPGSPLRAQEENTIFQFYQDALERVIADADTTVVPEGKIALWLVYNMGYVVKTPSHTFGIDIKHRDAVRLAPMLDFLCVTHNHQDHISMPLIEEMARQGKPVYSNFLDKGQRVASGDTLHPVEGIEIITNVADHNPQLPDFVVDYEIDCGEDTGHKVVLHLGDSRNWEQLRKTKPVDILIPHLAVGLDMPKAVTKLEPRIVLMSHVMELTHPIDKWRWSYAYGLDRCRELRDALVLPASRVLMPIWGEKILY